MKDVVQHMPLLLFLVALAVCFAVPAIAQIDTTPKIVEEKQAQNMQQVISDVAHTVYDKYATDNTPEIQRAIASELTEELKALVDSKQIQSFTVVCSEANNPPTVVALGQPVLFVLWTPINGDPVIRNRIIIGPEEAIRAIAQ